MKKIKKLKSLLFNKKKLTQALRLLKMFYLGRDTKYPYEVLELENKFARYLGVDHALSFCNGTTAFDSALFSLGLEDGDEVIICGMAFQSVVLTTLHNRLNIKFIDMDRNFNIQLEDKDIGEKSKLLVVSHLFGYPQNMDEVISFARKHGLKLIEDCSHAHGAEYAGKKLGSYGDVSFFSFQGEKAISGGEAGFAVTNQKEYLDKMKLYAHMGRDMQDIDVDLLFKGRGYGRKGRMHPFAAALAGVDIDYIDKSNSQLNASVDKVKKIIERFDYISAISKNDKATLGGFHYGLPLWVENESIAKKLVAGSNCFFVYPYALYHKFSCLSAGSDFSSMLKSGIPTRLTPNHTSLPYIEKAKDNLVFLNINVLRNIDEFSDDLIKNLASI